MQVFSLYLELLGSNFARLAQEFFDLVLEGFIFVADTFNERIEGLVVFLLEKEFAIFIKRVFEQLDRLIERFDKVIDLLHDAAVDVIGCPQLRDNFPSHVANDILDHASLRQKLIAQIFSDVNLPEHSSLGRFAREMSHILVQLLCGIADFLAGIQNWVRLSQCSLELAIPNKKAI